MTRHPAIFALALALVPSLANAAPQAERFHPSQATVTEGPFRKSIDTNVDYVLAHDPDRLLAPFLIAAGLEPKAEKYGNWESSGLDGHSAGHFLSAYATLSLASSDPRLDERLDYMLDELARCQNAHGDGYVGGVQNSDAFEAALRRGEINAERFSLNGAWVPWYNLHKTYAGLKDAWLVADREQAKDILLKLVDWTEDVTSNLSDEQMQQMLYAEHGGMNEIFADLYQNLGDERYLALAYRFTHHELLDPLLENRDALTGFHANTQIPKVIGFERTAIAADDDELHGAARFFWDTVVHDRSVSIGGNSVREHFHPADDFSHMLTSREGPETCNTHNMMRLTETLFQAAPSSELADYYERALYNHILSAQHPETGGLVYFTPMRPRHYRVYSVAENAFWCCVGSGIENPGRYSEFIYAKSDDTLFVNLFMPSQLNWTEKQLSLTQKTDFPKEETTTLTIDDAPSKGKLTLKIRRPSWVADGFSIHLNGKRQKVKIDDSGYATVNRRWRKGDTVTIGLPMSLRAERLPDGSDFVSFLYGPLVLASRAGDEEMPGLFAGSGRMEHIAPGPYWPLDKAPMLVGTIEGIEKRVEPIPDDSLQFKLTGDIRPEPVQPIVLEPFNRIHESRYSIYWQVASEQEYAKIQADLKEEEATRIALAERTVDQVAPGEQQSEVEHDYQGESSHSGSLLGRRFRESSEGFEYTLRSSPNDSLELAVTVFGSEWGKACSVKVNGAEVGTIELRSQNPDQFHEHVFPVPEALADSDELTVRIETIDQRNTPMVFDISLRKTQ